MNPRPVPGSGWDSNGKGVGGIFERRAKPDEPAVRRGLIILTPAMSQKGDANGATG